jgi:hypothetical protein
LIDLSEQTVVVFYLRYRLVYPFFCHCSVCTKLWLWVQFVILSYYPELKRTCWLLIEAFVLMVYQR